MRSDQSDASIRVSLRVLYIIQIQYKIQYKYVLYAIRPFANKPVRIIRSVFSYSYTECKCATVYYRGVRHHSSELSPSRTHSLSPQPVRVRQHCGSTLRGQSGLAMGGGGRRGRHTDIIFLPTIRPYDHCTFLPAPRIVLKNNTTVLIQQYNTNTYYTQYTTLPLRIILPWIAFLCSNVPAGPS